MSLLKQITKERRQQELIESAAAGSTSAGAVAGFRGSFFTPKKKKKKKKKKKLLRRNMPVGTIFSLRTEAVEDKKFDAADVISKLKTAEKKADHENETAGFALEDEEGRIVKVFVAQDQAQDFEAALGAALAGEDEDMDEMVAGENTSLEIAEILFNLKDRYTIVDVEWPAIEEDEEQQEDLEGEDEGGDAEGDLDVDLEAEGKDKDDKDDEGDMEAELQDTELGDQELGGEPEMKSTLDAVIDMLKAQADAQKAEAQAKEAEANAQEAKYNAQSAEAKVKQEEEILDMEAYYDEQSKADKEAKKLAKLAKWKHESAQKASNKMKGDAGKFKMPEKQEEDNEELNHFHRTSPPFGDIDKNKDDKLQPGEFIKYMLRNAGRY